MENQADTTICDSDDEEIEINQEDLKRLQEAVELTHAKDKSGRRGGIVLPKITK
jgi:hypothetical protein